jgi:tetratricopeptide (TPR) repeat protein
MLRKAWYLLALTCYTSTFVAGQSTSGQRRSNNFVIQGKVLFVDNRHDPDLRIEVRLESSSTQVITRTFADSAGNFEFGGLPAGSYNLSIDLEGYDPVRETANTFGNSSLTIVLSKMDAAPPKERPAGLDADDRDIVDVSQMRESLPKKAVQDYEKAIEEKRKGRIESALKLLEDAVRIAPNFFHAHNNLGLLYMSANRYDEAETEFKRGRALNPKSDRPLVNLGRVYIEKAALNRADREAAGKLLDQALDALEQAVRVNPRSALGYFLLGQANYRSNFLEEAEASFKKAFDIAPDLTAAQLMLANVYVRRGRWAEAVAVLDMYLKANPKAADRASVEGFRERIARTLEASTK